jgi:hypothetical protein
MRRRMRVAHTRREMHKDFWFGNLKERAHMEDVRTDGRKILKLTFQK